MTYYREEVVRSRRRAFGAGALAGALVVATIWGTLWALDSNDPVDSAQSESTTEPLDLPTVTTETPASRMQGCEEVFAAQTPVLATLARPLSQWRTQIGVTNKLVTGVMTLEEGMTFWDETRVAVLEALARYRSAHELFDERTTRCPGPDDGEPLPFELQCSTAVAARDAELSAADTALGSWQLHVRDLELLSSGETTKAEVSQRWPTTWREDVRELTTYGAAAQTAKGQTC